MSERLRPYCVINGRAWFEDDNARPKGVTIYHPYYISQESGPSRGTGCLIGGTVYPEQQLREYLQLMGEYQSSMHLGGGYRLTKQELEEILSPKPPALDANKLLDVTEISNTLSAIQKRWDSTQELDSSSEITISAGGGVDTPCTLEGGDKEGEEDELLKKIIENLQVKMQAVKRCKKLEAEVEGLRKVLAEKEADLVECQRIVALEAGQVQP